MALVHVYSTKVKKTAKVENLFSTFARFWFSFLLLFTFSSKKEKRSLFLEGGNLEKIMVSNRKNRIEIRGLSDQEIDYLKVLSRKNNFNSFNSFLVTMCREKIENGQFNQANNLYVAAIESMRETSQHTLELVEKQGRQISSLEESISNYAQYISRWLEYEGMVETDD